MKKTIMTAAALSLAFPLPVYALSEEEAVNTAIEYAGEEYNRKEAEYDDGCWEVELLSGTAKMEITVTDAKQLCEMEYELLHQEKSDSHTLNTKQVRKIITAQFKDAKSIRVRRRTSRKKGAYYKVTFKTEEYRAEAEISGEGVLLEYELEPIRPKKR